MKNDIGFKHKQLKTKIAKIISSVIPMAEEIAKSKWDLFPICLIGFDAKKNGEIQCIFSTISDDETTKAALIEICKQFVLAHGEQSDTPAPVNVEGIQAMAEKKFPIKEFNPNNWTQDSYAGYCASQKHYREIFISGYQANPHHPNDNFDQLIKLSETTGTVLGIRAVILDSDITPERLKKDIGNDLSKVAEEITKVVNMLTARVNPIAKTAKAHEGTSGSPG